MDNQEQIILIDNIEEITKEENVEDLPFYAFFICEGVILNF